MLKASLLLFILAAQQKKLDKITERQRLNGGNDAIRSRHWHKVCLLGHLWVTFEIDFDSSLASFLFCRFVFFHTSQNFGPAFGFAHVLDADVDALFNNAAIDFFVDPHTDGTLGDIENDSSASVVSLVWHTLVNGGIGKDIHVVARLDFHQVLAKVDGAMLPMFLGKHVARTRAGSEGVRHGLRFLLLGCGCVSIKIYSRQSDTADSKATTFDV